MSQHHKNRIAVYVAHARLTDFTDGLRCLLGLWVHTHDQNLQMGHIACLAYGYTQKGTHRWAHTQMGTHTDGYTHRWVHTQMGTHTDGYTHRWAHAQMGTHTDRYTQMGTHRWVHAQMGTRTDGYKHRRATLRAWPMGTHSKEVGMDGNEERERKAAHTATKHSPY